jgi:DNA repair exonuclease SbcCD ATPase subunit
MEGLSQFNYIYGPNGSGKTTISRVIANTESYPDCSVRWKGNLPLQEMVYNYDFVERNFTQAKELKGVFTLGEAQIETREKIAAIKKELDGLSGKNSDLRKTLEGAEGRVGKRLRADRKLESDFRNAFGSCKEKSTIVHFLLRLKAYETVQEKFRERFIKSILLTTGQTYSHWMN